MSNQSVTNADFASAAKHFHILFRTLYVVKFALMQFCISHFIRHLIPAQYAFKSCFFTLSQTGKTPCYVYASIVNNTTVRSTEANAQLSMHCICLHPCTHSPNKYLYLKYSQVPFFIFKDESRGVRRKK